MDELSSSILKTLTYFDIADYPLTKEELFCFLWQPPQVRYNEFLFHLKKIQPKFSYYFLPNREEIVEERRRKLLISEQKLKIAREGIKIIKSIPFLRAVFVCNTIASEQADKDSDIDFFIITAKNRIWITRFLITLALEFFHLRRVGKRINNKICLSFYVTNENLDLAPWRVAEDDVHFAYWLNQMLPIFDPENYYGKFLQANSWTLSYLPNIDIKQSDSYLKKIKPSVWGKIWQKVWEKMWQGKYGDLINNQAKKIQLAKMKFSGKSLDRAGDKGVVISDGVLKFHEKDTRAAYRNEWLSRINYAEKNI